MKALLAIVVYSNSNATLLVYLESTVSEVWRVEFLWVVCVYVALKCEYKRIGTFLSNIL